jgi:hypothetical protein
MKDMDRTPLIGKCLAVGIILLVIGASGPIVRTSAEKNISSLVDQPTIDITPHDGLYWNDRKIAEYPVPLFLHYYFKIKASIPVVVTIEASANLDKIEFYINDVLQETIDSPGSNITLSFPMTIFPFRHSPKVGIKVFLYAEELIILWGTRTIYRLFP